MRTPRPARALLVLGLCASLAAPAAATTRRSIDLYVNGGRVTFLGYDPGAAPDGSDDLPNLTGSVWLTFRDTEAHETDRIRLVVDRLAPVEFPASTERYVWTGLRAGLHVATAWLVDAEGDPYPGAVSVDDFVLSRVCDESADCVDDDPCSSDTCVDVEEDTGRWYGRCSHHLMWSSGSVCCVTGEWCRLRDLTLDDFGAAYQCVDVDEDGVGECVACTTDEHCQTLVDDELAIWGMTCMEAAVCGAGRQCEVTTRSGCCRGDADCYDGDACTEDVCDDVDQTCSNPPIPGCCRRGAEALPPGPPDFGCTPPDADPCAAVSCVGWGARATCRIGLRYDGCCDEDTDCTDPARLDPCTAPAHRPHGVCDAIGADARLPSLGRCRYDRAEPGCCTQHFDCADRWPEWVGACERPRPSAATGRCVYAPNPAHCAAPVDTVVITEIMRAPWTTDDENCLSCESYWFEVFNPTGETIDLQGWTVDWGGRTLVLRAFPIGPGRARVVGTGRFTGIYHMWLWFDPTAGRLALEDPSGVVRDEVVWDAGWPGAYLRSIALLHPYLDNADPANWRLSRNRFRCLSECETGTPGALNRDVSGGVTTEAFVCEDDDPCTLDLCHLVHADVCGHVRLEECCTATTAAVSCDDWSACTLDHCDAATYTCVHTPVGGCCVADGDCAGWYPDAITTQADREAFDLCAYKVCVANTCRYGRNLDRPRCCVGSDAAAFGCFDRNPCTRDVCVPDEGQDARGITFARCAFDLDLDADDVNDCCRLPADCDDGDPATTDTCDTQDDGEGPGVHRCWYEPDPLYCGPGSVNPTCDDGDPCTTDHCCVREGAPVRSCPAASRCVHIPRPGCCVSDQDCVDGRACTTDACVDGLCRHEEVAAGCCETHADCNGGNKPAEMYCRTGHCIASVCRYAPAIPGCCLTVDDCMPTTCAAYRCENHGCRPQPDPTCCTTSADCPPHPGACRTNVCSSNRCIAVDLPGCCEDANPHGPDASCDDADPCTADFCVEQDGASQCRHVVVGGAGCCADVEACPDDGVQCTAVACRGATCELDPVAECLSVSPYRMTFTEGHAVYAGAYRTVADLAWSATDERGTNEAAQFFGLHADGSLGPDAYLGFRPTASVASFDSCVVLPRFDTRGLDRATVGFDWAADGVRGDVTLALRGGGVPLPDRGGGWSGAEPVWRASITADAAPTHVNVPLPAAILDADHTRVAFCVAGATTDAVEEVMIDQVVLARGAAPHVAAIASRRVAVGEPRTFAAAFRINEPDADDTVTLALERPPGPWVRIADVRRATGVPTERSAGVPTEWTADLVITGAVCPPRSPHEYALQVTASDGALRDTKPFVLAVDGCP